MTPPLPILGCPQDLLAPCKNVEQHSWPCYSEAEVVCDVCRKRMELFPNVAKALGAACDAINVTLDAIERRPASFYADDMHGKDAKTRFPLIEAKLKAALQQIRSLS